MPFRTWQNTITAQAAKELTELFGFRSSAHVYQAVLNGEGHIHKNAHITTLSGYVHYMLTGVNAIGIGEASGMFPIDPERLDYDAGMLAKLNGLAAFGANKAPEEALEDYSNKKVFANTRSTVLQPDDRDITGFKDYMQQYKAMLAVENTTVEQLS